MRVVCQRMTLAVGCQSILDRWQPVTDAKHADEEYLAKISRKKSKCLA